MPLKFRLSGLAETFIEEIRCPKCGHDGGEGGDQGFKTELTRVTLDGIIVVIQCQCCGHIFVPEGQKRGVIDAKKLRLAVEKDSSNTGQPILSGINAVKLEVERLNAQQQEQIH